MNTLSEIQHISGISELFEPASDQLRRSFTNRTQKKPPIVPPDTFSQAIVRPARQPEKVDTKPLFIIILGALQNTDIDREPAHNLLQTSNDHVSLTERKLRWCRLASADLNEKLKHMTASNVSAAEQRSQEARRCGNGSLMNMPLHNRAIINPPVCM
ncbi:hypothetical protein [Sorangium sp. So ce233]|uniref:hypothetical protein n=1 Tax=Sorangium sp. So ce233 TaxID=3133290 RepID=UPI003F5D5E03